MANEKNLIPMNQRTKSEQRRIAIEGGVASGESRRRRKSLKESMNMFLGMIPTNQGDYNKLVRAGIPAEEIDNSQLIVLALFQRAATGDVAAIKEIRDLIGEGGSDDNGRLEALMKGLKDE